MVNSLKRLSRVGVFVVASFAIASLALAASYSFFGEAGLVEPGNSSMQAAEMVSDSSNATPYGGVSFDVPAGLTFADLTKLSSDFNVTDDDCGGGSPRFSVKVDTGGGVLKNIFVYLGPAPNYTGCTPNTWVASGDLLESGLTVDTGQLPGGTFYHDYDAAVTAYGAYPVTAISLVTDASWLFPDGEQTILADNVMINDDVHTFENKDSCKKDGWQLFTSAPGPFKNQGQCVSYFARQQ